MVLLSLLAAPHQGADAADRSAALVRLLLGATPAEVAPLLGPDGPWTVIHARRSDGTTADALTAGALGASLGSALVDAGREDEDETVRVLLPATASEAPPHLGDGEEPGEPRDPGKPRQPPQPPTVPPHPGWTLGVSTPTPLSALAAADTRAARALAHAEATRTPLKVDAPVTGLAALIPPDRQPPTPALS